MISVQTNLGWSAIQDFRETVQLVLPEMLSLGRALTVSIFCIVSWSLLCDDLRALDGRSIRKNLFDLLRHILLWNHTKRIRRSELLHTHSTYLLDDLYSQPFHFLQLIQAQLRWRLTVR